MNISRILVPVDFSKSSVEGVKMASEIARLFGSQIDLIHVIPIISYFNESFDLMELPLDMEKDLYPKAQEIASMKLQEFADKYIPFEHFGKLYDVGGRKVFREIIELTNEHHDLIVMSNKGGHASESVRSHITEKVIQYAEVPVLSVARKMETSEIKNILVLLDRSEKCGRALVPAFEFARVFKTKLTVLHIIEPYTLGMEVPETITVDEEVVYENLMENLDGYFSDHPDLKLKLDRGESKFEDVLTYTEAGSSQSIPLTTIMKRGLSADEEICTYAEEYADLVIMSTHGRSGFTRFLLGSTTSQVALHLHKPLLTYRIDD